MKNQQRSLVEILDEVLGVVGNHYDSEYAYYIEKDVDGITTIYEWCNEDIPSMRDRVKNISKDDAPKWLESEVKDTTEDAYSVFEELEDDKTAVLAVINVRRGGCTISLMEALLPLISETIVLVKSQKQHEFLTFHDQMTGLLNKNSYISHVEELSRARLRSLGALSVNVNGLKEFNKEFGRDYGDEIVIRVGEVLEEYFRGYLTFRLTGDEYLIIAKNIAYEDFMKKMNQAYTFLEHISLGLTTMGHSWEKSNIQVRDVIYQAQEMMKSEKSKHYSRKLKGRHVPIIKNDLLEDIKHGNFVVYLIPKFDVYSNRVAGAEAVVRYYHKDLGTMYNERYMKLLEDTNLSSYLDLHIFEEVCKTLQRWEAADLPMIPIAVNFSSATLQQESIADKVIEIIEKYEASCEYLEIEISEKGDNMNQEMLAEISRKMRKVNIRTILDHFGAKHSSFSILNAMEFDSLKIDESLIANIVIDSRNQIIVKAVVDICHRLGGAVAADGVETKDQLNVLKEFGCDYVQGTYFNKPIAIDTFEVRYLKN